MDNDKEIDLEVFDTIIGTYNDTVLVDCLSVNPIEASNEQNSLLDDYLTLNMCEATNLVTKGGATKRKGSFGSTSEVSSYEDCDDETIHTIGEEYEISRIMDTCNHLDAHDWLDWMDSTQQVALVHPIVDQKISNLGSEEVNDILQMDEDPDEYFMGDMLDPSDFYLSLSASPNKQLAEYPTNSSNKSKVNYDLEQYCATNSDTNISCQELKSEGAVPPVQDGDIPDIVNLFNSMESPVCARNPNAAHPFNFTNPYNCMTNQSLSTHLTKTSKSYGNEQLETLTLFNEQSNNINQSAKLPYTFSLPVYINPNIAAQGQGRHQSESKHKLRAKLHVAAAMNNVKDFNGNLYNNSVLPQGTDPLQIFLQQQQTRHILQLQHQQCVARSGKASTASGKKISSLVITPDISDFKLVQIFHTFCQAESKLLSAENFHCLLQHHQLNCSEGLEAGKTQIAGLAQPNGQSKCSEETLLQSDNFSTPSSSNPASPSAESVALFNLLVSPGINGINLEKFMSSFQICNRCTEIKRRNQAAISTSQGHILAVPTALERQLMEDVAPVIVRVVPTKFEGTKVKSCEHYQWTWCPGFETTGNEKCKGTNRHDKCPKYLANCTLWKHKLPPKSRKAKISVEDLNMESPTKKIKFFE